MLTRFDPFREMNQLRRAMDRVFDDTLERRYSEFDQNVSALALDVLENEKGSFRIYHTRLRIRIHICQKNGNSATITTALRKGAQTKRCGFLENMVYRLSLH